MGKRADKAFEYFKEGCNCAQAVFMAYADKYGIDRETAMKISSSFGGGMGRMREVCGAFSGMLLVNGMEMGTADSKNREAKVKNYKIVQELRDEFVKENGALYCRDLLGANKRPCVEIVRSAVEILEEKFPDE